MTNITLKQLRYFEALAEHRHFGRAAEACLITQPALSVQIKELEETLSAPLFERGPREVRLTSFGETFGRRARDILRAVDELGELARAAGGGFAGRLRLGVIPTIAPYLLPQILSALSDRYPGLDVHVRETLTDGLIRELKAGRIDAAILALPVSEPSFVETTLFEEDFLLVRPASEAPSSIPAVADLRNERLLLLEEGHCFRDQALSLCGVRPSEPREGMDGSSLSTLVQMAGAGLGVTLIPAMAEAVETKAANVAVARFPSQTPKRTVGMIWRNSNPLTSQLQGVAAHLRDTTAPDAG